MYKRAILHDSLNKYRSTRAKLWPYGSIKKFKQASNFRHSLDDVMRDLLTEAKRASASKNFSVQEIASVVDSYIHGVFAPSSKK